MTADDVMEPFMRQVGETSWVTHFEVEIGVPEGSCAKRFTFEYLRLPQIFIDGPQEQFLARAEEVLDTNRRSFRFLSGGGQSVPGRFDWRGRRTYEWFPGQEAQEWNGRRLMLELPPKLLELLS